MSVVWPAYTQIFGGDMIVILLNLRISQLTWDRRIDSHFESLDDMVGWQLQGSDLARHVHHWRVCRGRSPHLGPRDPEGLHHLNQTVLHFVVAEDSSTSLSALF